MPPDERWLIYRMIFISGSNVPDTWVVVIVDADGRVRSAGTGREVPYITHQHRYRHAYAADQAFLIDTPDLIISTLHDNPRHRIIISQKEKPS